MKNIFIALLVIVGLLGCDSSKVDKANLDLVERYIAAVESKDYQVMEELLAEDYLGLGPSVGDSIDRAGALASWKYNIENLYESIHYELSRNAIVNIVDGDNQGAWVTNWAQLKIEYKENDKSVTLWANTNYFIQNGKIKKSYTFYNEADALRQLDYVFIDLNDL